MGKRSRVKRKNRKLKFEKTDHHSNNPSVHAPTTAELSLVRKIGVGITFISGFMLLITGLYAALNRDNEIFGATTFVIGFITLALAFVAAYPQFTRHLKGSWRMVLYIPVTLLVMTSIPLAWLALQEPVIKIGVSLPFDGEDKEDALPIFYAVQQAFDGVRINNHKVVLVPFHAAKEDADKIRMVEEVSTNVLKVSEHEQDISRITGDAQVAAIIGPFNSGVALEQIPATRAAGIPMISPSTTLDCLTTDKCKLANKEVRLNEYNGTTLANEPTFFRTVVPDSVRAEVMARYFAQNHKKVAIVTDATSFGGNFANQFANCWVEQTSGCGTEHPDRNDSGLEIIQILNGDVATTLDAMATADTSTGESAIPDLIFFAGTGATSRILHTAIIHRPEPEFARTTFVGAATIMNDDFNYGNRLATSTFSSGLYAVAPLPYAIAPRGTNTLKGKDHTPYSASAYDAAKLLAEALEKANSPSVNLPLSRWDIPGITSAKKFRDNIVASLRDANHDWKTSYKDGLTRPIMFDENGNVMYEKRDATRNISIYKYSHKGPATADEGWANVLFALKK